MDDVSIIVGGYLNTDTCRVASVVASLQTWSKSANFGVNQLLDRIMQYVGFGNIDETLRFEIT